jgi:hypothetical protein
MLEPNGVLSKNIELALNTYDEMLGEYGRFSRDLTFK